MTPLSKLITPEGLATLRGELDELWREERPRVTAEVAAAAALGDRSENAEYIYGKKRLREIDRRLRWLKKRIEELEVIDPAQQPPGRVAFGAHVSLEDEDGGSVTYQLVGTDEFDVDAGRISIKSPLARALIGKEVDDEIEFERPRGTKYYVVTKIRFGPEG